MYDLDWELITFVATNKNIAQTCVRVGISMRMLVGLCVCVREVCVRACLHISVYVNVVEKKMC